MGKRRFSASRLDMLRDDYVVKEGYVISDKPERESNGLSFKIFTKQYEEILVKLPYSVKVNKQPEAGDFFIASGVLVGGLLRVSDDSGVAAVGVCCDRRSMAEARSRHDYGYEPARKSWVADRLRTEQIHLVKRDDRQLYEELVKRWKQPGIKEN